MTETLGKYRLVRLLATGGMAEVYLARQAGAAGFEKQVCLKRILPHLARDQRFVAMFLDEARLASRLDHPNIVSIFDLGEANGSYFIAMEYIDGPTLRTVAQGAAERGEPLPVAEVVRIAAQAAGGLHYAHELRAADGRGLGLVHRDISPDNVMVHRNGAVKIVDFGIAKAAGTQGATRTGTLKGKVAYMAPEALRGEPLDRRADVFALGVVLYELLAGRRPWEAASEVALISCIVNEEPRPLPELRPDVPQELWAIVARALAKDAGQRLQTCGEMQAELERHLIAWGESITSSRLAQFVAACAPQEPATDPAAPAARPPTPDRLQPSTPGRGLEPTPADGPSRPPPRTRTARVLQQEFRDEPRAPAGRARVAARRRSRGPAAALLATAAVVAAALVGAAAAAGGSGGAWAGWGRLTAAAQRLGLSAGAPTPGAIAPAAPPGAASDAQPGSPSGSSAASGLASAAPPAPDALAVPAAASPAISGAPPRPAPASSAPVVAAASTPGAALAPASSAAAGQPAPSASAASPQAASPAAPSSPEAAAPPGVAAIGAAALARTSEPGDGGVGARAADPPGGGSAPRDAVRPDASAAAGGAPAADAGPAVAAGGATDAPREGAAKAPAAQAAAAPQATSRAQPTPPVQAVRKPRRKREEDRLSVLARIAPDGPPEPSAAEASPAPATAEAAPAARPPDADAGAPAAAQAAPAAPPSPPGKGELLLLVRPWARVEVDGRPVGDTPLSSPLELAEGDHRVRLVNPDLGKDVTRTVHVRARERAVLKEMLDE